MNALDFIIISLALLSMVGGYRLGFLARAFSWVGLALGIVAAVILIPMMFRHQATTNPNRMFYALGVLAGLAFIGQTAGTIVGSLVRDRIPHTAVRKSDHLLGAMAGAIGVLFFAWMLLPTIAQQPTIGPGLVNKSAIAQNLEEKLPHPPNALQVLERFVGKDRFPEVFDAFRPSFDIPDPPKDVALTPDVVARVRKSAVRVVAFACRDRLQEGSGYFVSSNLVVTNAHVIAGGSEIAVYLDDGRRAPARAVAFDSNRDVAVLRVDRLSGPALPFAEPKRDTPVAVFGHPGGQVSLRIAPGTVAERIDAVGRDIYDSHQTTRDVLVLASALKQGDSGSAVVNTKGEVVGLAFAIAPDKEGEAFALAPSEVKPVVQGVTDKLVSTGKCVPD